jgi:cytoplasmic iron level regulating protein YaaA (DUF328/UPF0246 family)
MLILLSPAKKLLNIHEPYDGISSLPIFAKKTKILAQLMKKKSAAEIAALMHLSQDLAQLNYDRYQTFSLTDKSPIPPYPALFMFQGDVYQGMNAISWEQSTISYAQEHLRILSGLYGLLSPLDAIQAYRLEMGIRLENPVGKNLYDFWQETITSALNQQLETHENPYIINLASVEYFKVINEKQLKYPVITINFYEKKQDKLKIIGIHAKKARGTMAKFLMQNQYDDLIYIKHFNELGYQFNESTSTHCNFDFVR